MRKELASPALVSREGRFADELRAAGPIPPGSCAEADEAANATRWTAARIDELTTPPLTGSRPTGPILSHTRARADASQLEKPRFGSRLPGSDTCWIAKVRGGRDRTRRGRPEC